LHLFRINLTADNAKGNWITWNDELEPSTWSHGITSVYQQQIHEDGKNSPKICHFAPASSFPRFGIDLKILFFTFSYEKKIPDYMGSGY
jgi:hypothetical protein